jgi:hypothetical protein
MSGIPATVPALRTGADLSYRQQNPSSGVIVMAIGVLLFLVLIALASRFGLVADSRDSADWKPSFDGARASRWE